MTKCPTDLSSHSDPDLGLAAEWGQLAIDSYADRRSIFTRQLLPIERIAYKDKLNVVLESCKVNNITLTINTTNLDGKGEA